MIRIKRIHIAIFIIQLLIAYPSYLYPQKGKPKPNKQLTIDRVQDLNIGILITGDLKDIPPGSAESAMFQITSKDVDTLNITFTLPATLNSTNGQVAIIFNANSACWAPKKNPNLKTTFDPNQGTQLTISNGNPIYVWIGGYVSILLSQPAGNYTNTITITATSISQ